MAIVNNTLSEIGDVLIVKVQLAIRGNVDLTNFTDSVSGETASRFFTKRFKYSFDNLNWSDLITLNVANIQSITGHVPGLLFMEFFYERSGSDNTGLLEFLSIDIEGDIDVQICINTDTLESIFKDLAYDNSITSEIANNLLRKIYYNGILPNFIDRGEGIDDEDFISFWSAVCFYMALIINFSNTFDEILYRRNYLAEYLSQRGLKLCKQETILEDLQYLANNFKDEIRKRGTIHIVKEKGEQTSYGETISVRGELLRLICKNHFDEFLFEIMERKNMGFFIENSSILYNGTNRSNQLNKTPENTELFNDLGLYETIGTIVLNSGIAVISGDAGGVSGIGKDLFNNISTDVDLSLLTPVDKEIDYEITFQIKKDVATIGDFKLNFGVLGYNRNGIYKPLSFKKIGPTQTIQNYFLKDIQIDEIVKVQDVWYNIRGIIYASKSMTQNTSDSRMNINKGSNLKFNHDEQIENLLISIYTDSTDAGKNFQIKDFKFRPLIRGRNILSRSESEANNIFAETPYVKNPHFIQQGNTIYSYMKNNSDDMTDNQIVNFIEKYLIPYQQKLVGIFLEPKVDDKQLLT